MKKKFFEKPDYSERFNFEDILNSLKEVKTLNIQKKKSGILL